MSMAALKWARDQRGLGGPAAAVLRDLADRANSEAMCWPSVAKIAEATGYSRRTVQRALRRLEADKLIATRRTGSGSRYLLALEGGRQSDAGASERRPGGVTVTHQKRQSDAGGRHSDAQSLKKHSESKKPCDEKTEEPDRVTLEQINAYIKTIGKPM
jgi:DNA-binding transcriptional ArsR family regulator